MAIVNLANSTITALNASPLAKMDPGRGRSPVMFMQDTVAIASGNSDTSTYRIMRVQSNWVFLGQVLDSTDCMAASGVFDVGLYIPDGGAVVDADCLMDGQIAASVTINSNSTDSTNAVGAFGEVALAGLKGDIKRFWQLAGESADTNVSYDITLSILAADADQAGTVTYTLLYSDMGINAVDNP